MMTTTHSQVLHFETVTLTAQHPVPARPNPVGIALPTIALFRAVIWCFCSAGDSQGHGLGTYVSAHPGALSAHLGALYSGEFRNRVVV